MLLEIDHQDLAYVTGGGSSSASMLMMALMMTRMRGAPISDDRRQKLFEMMKMLMEPKGGKPAEGGK